jgi:hypothetical protein
MKVGAIMAGVAVGLLGVTAAGCSYHTHIHNHLPPGYAFQAGYSPQPARQHGFVQPMAVPKRRAGPRRLDPSPYSPYPPNPYPRSPRTDSLVGLADGSFASGGLEPGWHAAGTEGGFAAVVQQGEAWSGATAGVSFPSPPFAALIRSSGQAPVSSVGVLFSKPFIVAAKRLVWKQQSEALAVKIVVEVEDAAGGGVLAAMDVPPSVGAFQSQQLDVSAACGRPVRVLVRQHTTSPGAGYYTVFDDVRVVGAPCGRGNPYQPTHL